MDSRKDRGRKRRLSEDQQAAWEEWLAHPQTRRYLASLKARGLQMSESFREQVYQSPDLLDRPESRPHLMELRSQSMIYEGLSGLSVEVLEELLEDEHEAD